MATLTQLRARFRQICKLADQTDVDEGDPTQAVITQLLNDSINRRYSSLITSYPFRFLTRLTMSYIASQESTALPATAQGRMISLVRALPVGTTDAVQAYDLDPVAVDELDSYEFYGTPLAYAIDMVSQEIFLRPVPQTTMSLQIYAVAALTDLASSSDTPAWCPSEFHQLFPYDAAAMYMAEAGDQNSQQIKDAADGIYENLKIFVERNYQDVRFKNRARRLF